MSPDPNTVHSSEALVSTWDSYQDWAAFARDKKRSLLFWRKLVLLLGLGGAIFETLAASVFAEVTIGQFNVFGFLGFIMLGVAAYFGRNVLGGQPERLWVGARSVAEALKSESFKFCVQVDPYHEGDRESRLATKKKQIGESTGLSLMVPDPGKRAGKPVPTETMSVDEYVSTRLKSQIDPNTGYYWSAARENAATTRKFRGWALLLGVVSTILGGFGAFGVTGIAIWVAVLTTVSGSIAAYFQAGRFEYLALSYGATGHRLTNLLDVWNANPDPQLASAFVFGCEEAISVENQAWLAEWLSAVDQGGKK
ncbi:DUF4231 domain-containing protein [Gemmatimonadota bacterium]